MNQILLDILQILRDPSWNALGVLLSIVLPIVLTRQAQQNGSHQNENSQKHEQHYKKADALMDPKS